MKVIIGSSLLFFLITIMGCGSSSPMPYSEEALKKLNSAIEKIGTPVPQVGASKEESAGYAVEYYRKVFKKAGYDLDKSIIKFANDFEQDPAFFKNPAVVTQTPFLLLAKIIEQTIEIRKTVSIDANFSRETLVALDKIVANEKKQAEDAVKAKFAKEEAIKKAMEDADKGIFRGEIVNETSGGMDTRGHGYSLSDMKIEAGFFGMLTIAEYSALEKKPELHQQLKQLVGKRVTLKGKRGLWSSGDGHIDSNFDLDKGIEIIPDQQ